MKTLPLFLSLLLCLPLCSCAMRLYYPNGRPAFADYTNFNGTTEIHAKGFYFKRSGVQDAATPTTATGNAVVKGIITAGGGAVAL